ncbi:GGDEF domain-containing protein [Devosia pacifica]|uniref:GGDEF domain-containing protein n=1 Tax=Devosia pacifica TaxID=1335967 RepID=UPI00167785A3|nr:diguanylate cyclase [Devosia pacifica]
MNTVHVTDSLAGLVEATLRSGFRLLRFPAELEARFERDTGPARSRSLLVWMIAGMVIYSGFLLSDLLLMPDAFAIALLMRLGLVGPVALAFLVIIARKPPPFVREGSQVLLSALAAAALPVIAASSTDPLSAVAHHGQVLFVIYITMIQRVRFWYALAGVLIMQLIYLVTLAGADGVFRAQISYLMVFAGVATFAVVAAYNLEHEARLTYLMRLRETLRSSELEHISRQDPLTGLGNRRALDDRFAEQAASCKWGDAQQLALLIVDIDHFKAYNDTLGHQAGDVCLKRVAGVIASELRGGSDTAYRFGGEEFLVVLADTERRQALRIAERMRAAIETAAIPHPAILGNGVVTASFGVAATVFNERSDPADLIAMADAALYAAKRDGRNRVWPRPATAASITKRVPGLAVRAS